MSLMVVDMTTFSASINVYEFSEEGTKIEKIKANPKDIANYLAQEISGRPEIDKITIVGAESYTSDIKNRVSSLLETQYEQKNPIEIELKNDFT